VGYGLGTSAGNVAFSAVIQSHVEDRLRGRVFSAFDLIWQSMRLVSLLAGGLIADAAGIRAVYYLGGALLMAASVAGLTLAGLPAGCQRDRAQRSPAGHGRWLRKPKR
jgi:MFS family permease